MRAVGARGPRRAARRPAGDDRCAARRWRRTPVLGRLARRAPARSHARPLRLLFAAPRSAVQRRSVRKLFLQRASAAADPQQRTADDPRKPGEGAAAQSAPDGAAALRCAGRSAASAPLRPADGEASGARTRSRSAARRRHAPARAPAQAGARARSRTAPIPRRSPSRYRRSWSAARRRTSSRR